MCLYLFCYALSGALLRRHLLDRAGAEWTWMFSLALLIIGCVVPFLVGMMVFMGSAWWNTGFGKWLVGNPFVWDVEAHRSLYLSVGTVWATLAAAFNLHWFIERMKAFRSESTVENRGMNSD
jgi:ABC-type Fe3+ transport system permease subunit